MDILMLKDFAKLIGDGIVIAVIVFLYIMDRNKKNKESEEDRKKLSEEREEYKKNYDNLVNKIIDGVNSHHLTPIESENIAQIERKINETIKDILNETNASRVCIVKYHNGNKDMMGRSFLKMSMTNEVVNKGIASIMCTFKDLFRSYLAYWCNEIDNNKECIISNVNDLQGIDMTMFQYLSTLNIEAEYGIALKNLDEEVIGFLCVEYLDKKDFDEKNIKNTLNKNYRKIETLLTINGMEGDSGEL